MKIDELIDRLNELADCAEIWGAAEDKETVRKAAETIRLLWEVAKDTTNSKYKRQIDEMRCEDAVYAETH